MIPKPGLRADDLAVTVDLLAQPLGAVEAFAGVLTLILRLFS
jgi:hypothetical protein